MPATLVLAAYLHACHDTHGMDSRTVDSASMMWSMVLQEQQR